MDIEAWLQAAIADAERRGLPELAPLLRALAGATEALRNADFARTVSADGRPTPLDDLLSHAAPPADADD